MGRPPRKTTSQGGGSGSVTRRGREMEHLVLVSLLWGGFRPSPFSLVTREKEFASLTHDCVCARCVLLLSLSSFFSSVFPLFFPFPFPHFCFLFFVALSDVWGFPSYVRLCHAWLGASLENKQTNLYKKRKEWKM